MPVKPPKKPQAKITKPAQRPDNGPFEGIRAVLENIARDTDASPTARTQAARSLAEMDGLIGRHQQAPGAGTDAAPLSEMTRPELEAELARLRQRFAASPD